MLGCLCGAQSNRADIQRLFALAASYFLHVLRPDVPRLGYTDDRNAAIERLVEVSSQTRPLFLKPYIAINENNLDW